MSDPRKHTLLTYYSYKSVYISFFHIIDRCTITRKYQYPMSATILDMQAKFVLKFSFKTILKKPVKHVN